MCSTGGLADKLELLYLSWFTPIPNREASTQRAEVVTTVAPSFKWATLFLIIVKAP